MLYDAVCGDSMDIIFRELCNPLDPDFGIAGISSASKLVNFRDLLSPQTLQWLRSRHVAAEALAHKARMSRDQLRLALTAEWDEMAALNEDDMQMLGTLSSLLPVLRHCRVVSSGPGVVQLAAKLRADAFPSLVRLCLQTPFGPSQMGDPGAVALAAALRRGAMPKLEELCE